MLAAELERARAARRRSAGRRAHPRGIAPPTPARPAASCRASATRSACSSRRSSRSWSTTRRNASIAAASRASASMPIWEWISRDLMPQEAKTYLDQVSTAARRQRAGRTPSRSRAPSRICAEQRMREIAGQPPRPTSRRARRVAAQIGTPQALEDVREIGAILRVRDALGVIASRLPASIRNLADEQLENVKTLLESPIGRHRDVFLYALLLVMSRLGSPWQLIRLAIQAAGSDVAARIAETPFAVAVEIVLADVERMIADLARQRESRARRPSRDARCKDMHDAARGCAPSSTSRRIRPGRASSRRSAPKSRICCRPRSRICPVRCGACCVRVPPRRPGRMRRSTPSDVDEIEAKLVLAARLPQLCGRACDQRGDPAGPFRSAELFRQRHAGR